MNWTRVGIVASVVLCVWLAWPKGESAAPPRPLLIRAALKDAVDPVVILGDSIVALATFPRSICGRPIVNAGIGGSTTASGLDAMLIKAIGNKQAAMIIVSVGMNDAMASLDAEKYKANYLAMLAMLKKATPRLAIATATPMEAGASPTDKKNSAAIDNYNSVLPAIAQQTNATLIAIPPMPAKHTTDGIHLNADGYVIWTQAMLDNAEAAICKTKPS